MALGDGTGWNTSAPANTDLRSVGAAEIRDLRTGVGIRIDKEHVALSSSSAGGEHKEGSAVIYTEPTVTFPTNKPDGSTSLDSADEGRRAMVAGWSFVYSGTGWGTNSAGSTALTSSFSSWIDVGYAFRAIIISHSGGANGIIIFNGTGNQSSRFLNTQTVSETEVRLEFETEQDSGNPTDAYRFRWKLETGNNGTYSYLVLR